jgi:hypothetical protein
MTETPQEDVILEPGDPGYVAPEKDESNTQGAEVPEGEGLTPPPTLAEGGYTDPNQPPPTEPVVASTDEGEVPMGEDLQHVQQPGESDADFAARTRGVVVGSQSPTDIVPNTPQITMGQRVQIEGTDPPAYVGVPPEFIDEDQPEAPEGEVPPEGEEGGEEPPPEEPVVEETPAEEPKA